MNFSVASLARFAADALELQGVPAADAQLTARSLVQADQRGIHSHGLLRLPLYVDALRQGGINPRPQLAIERDSGPTALLDADAGLGQVAMQAAVDLAIERAGRHGVCVVSVERSSHYGAGAFWTDQLVAHGMVGLLTSSTGPTVAVHGGARKVLGTNPLTIAAPTGRDLPLTVDMATSAGAFGKIIAARQAGTPIPEGWAVSPDGRPTTDPHEAAAGSLIAFGGHKGSGLAVLLEALAVGLGEATFAYETQDIWDNPASRMNNGHLLIAIDTAAFIGREATEAKVRGLQDAIGASGDDVVLPGQTEHENEKRWAADVPLSESTAAALVRLADDLRLPAPPAADD
jgi:L-2-hydroxycarboxylate dehydrogenase (NAD+)